MNGSSSSSVVVHLTYTSVMQVRSQFSQFHQPCETPTAAAAVLSFTKITPASCKSATMAFFSVSPALQNTNGSSSSSSKGILFVWVTRHYAGLLSCQASLAAAAL
jgi:hypothetical protein